jgi:hypothetical protein
MALIYRSILELGEDRSLDASAALFTDWVKFKARDDSLSLAVEDGPREVPLLGASEPMEVVIARGETEGLEAFRGRLIETREDGEKLTSTATTIVGRDAGWFWFDLERSSANAWERPWTPFSPKLVQETLKSFECSRGTNGFSADYLQLEGDQGALLAGQLMDSEREVPFVVISASNRELRDGQRDYLERADEINRRLRGVTPVYVLGDGAVTSFSRKMLDLTDSPAMDVHSGATRIYLPGIGGPTDYPGRHRYMTLDRFAKRRKPATALAGFVATSVLRLSTHQRPPEIWAELSALPAFSDISVSDPDWDEFQRDADAQAVKIEKLEGAVEDHELQIMMLRDEIDEHLAVIDGLNRTNAFLSGRVEKVDLETASAAAQAQVDGILGEIDNLETCEEAVGLASSELRNLRFGDKVAEGVTALDRHSVPTWAKKALRSFIALDAYAKWKVAGGEGNFMDFLDLGQMEAIPKTWVALSESETTDQNERFRQLRVFSVPTEVATEGRVYMPAHIKLEPGGNPAPRIHFYDHHDGDQCQIFIGWLGPHLDNKSKN